MNLSKYQFGNTTEKQIMFRSNTVWFAPVVLTLVCTGPSVLPAYSAQSEYTFNANYEGIISLVDTIPPADILKFVTEAESSNAPFGLTNANQLHYALNTPDKVTITTVPNVFGLKDEPDGFLSLFGTGSDKLFGTYSGTSKPNPGNLQTFSGTVNITGGEGRFLGAEGTLTFSGGLTYPRPSPIWFSLDGSFTTNGSSTEPTPVPEPSSILGLLVFGAFGAGSVLKRSQTKQKSKGF